MVAEALSQDGHVVFPFEPEVAAWAAAARQLGRRTLSGDVERRHGATWFVGVDALRNAGDGSVDGVPLAGTWLNHVTPPTKWHQAQLSVIFPRYPLRDADESEAAHRFRRNRDAAHVDGLLPEGPNRRRHLREPHGFIVGFPLDDVSASPLVVWPGSHKIIREFFAKAFTGMAPKDGADLDVTDVYQIARRAVFEVCVRVEVLARPGQAILLDRHLVHGVAPWGEDQAGEMRMMAYFRPQIAIGDWL
jgi:hypothetical protein